jgi:hypothetical protein
MALNFPASPSEDDLYTAEGTNFLFKGGAWTIVTGAGSGSTATYGTTFPPTPLLNDQHYLSEGNVGLYQYVDDGDSLQWIQTNGSLNNALLVEEFLDPTGVNSWRKVGNVLEQWGAVSITADVGGTTKTKTVVLLEDYADTEYVLTLSAYSSSAQTKNVALTGRAVGQFDAVLLRDNLTTTVILWHSIGEAAVPAGGTAQPPVLLATGQHVLKSGDVMTGDLEVRSSVYIRQGNAGENTHLWFHDINDIPRGIIYHHDVNEAMVFRTYDSLGVLDQEVILGRNIGGKICFAMGDDVPIGIGQGIISRLGAQGSYSGNTHNFNWLGGSVNWWVDTTLVGLLQFQSDERVKTIHPNFMHSVNPVWDMKTIDYNWANGNWLVEDDGIRRHGFSANNILDHAPEIVIGEPDGMTSDGKVQPMGVDYNQIIAHLVDAVQELKAEIEVLKNGT